MFPKTSISCGFVGAATQLCWGCHTASLWGPCEHAYCCMEHEGHSSATSLPKAKPKGRPSRKAKAISTPTPTVPSQIVPAHSTSEIADTGQGAPSSSTAGVSSDHLELRSLLQSAALGRFYQPMVEQSVTISALRRFGIADFFTFFGSPLLGLLAFRVLLSHSRVPRVRVLGGFSKKNVRCSL